MENELYYAIVDSNGQITDFGIGEKENGISINYGIYKKLMRGKKMELIDGDFCFVDFLTKTSLIMKLESKIDELKDRGIEYQGKMFKCDDEAKTNLSDTLLMADVLLAQGPITWYTRNGEQGYIEFYTKEEFMQFMLTLGMRIAELKNKYYSIKTLINDCEETQEALSQIDIDALLA